VTTIAASAARRLWPSGAGTRIYVGLGNADAVGVIDTSENKHDRDDPDRQRRRAWPIADAGAHRDGKSNLQPSISRSGAKLTLAGVTERRRPT